MKSLMLTLLLFIVFQLNAQTACESQRYISEVFSANTLTSGVYFGSDDPYGILNNQDLYLDVYEPAGDTLDKRPVIIHQYGGGYLIGWRSEPNIPDFAEMYTKRGFVFVSIDYRIGFNPLESASAERAVYRGILDLRASLRFLVDNADTYGIDTSNIFLTGTSAGSISAMGQTFMDDNDRPASTFGTFLEPSDLGCISCTGNSNFGNQEVKIHGIINNWGAVLDTSIIDVVDDPLDNVPVISFHGTNDNAVMYVEGPPFSVPYFPSMQGAFLIHQRLESIEITNELHPLIGFGHEPQLLNPDLADTIVIYASEFLYDIMQGEISPISGDSSVCLNDEVSYSVPITNESSYCWEAIGGTILNESVNTILVKWDNVGTHTLNLYELTCIEVTKPRNLQVEVASPISATINYSSENGLFDFSGNFVSNGSYDWSFGDGSLGSSQMTSHQYTHTGYYEVILEIDNDFCKATDTIEIESDICPEADFTYVVNDSSVTVNNISLFSSSSFWLFGDGSNGVFDATEHTYSTEGTYIIQMIVSNDFCNDTIERTIEISFCADADFEITINGLDISLTNNSYNQTSNFWNFGDGNTNGTFEPSYTFASSGTYDIQLIVYNANLCSDTIIQTILVEDKDTVSSISSIQNKKLISVYPNPSDGNLFILNESSSHLKYSLTNLLGQTILSGNTEQNETIIDLNSFTNGIYILSIAFETNIYTERILKQ